jgi:UDP-glucose:(glucosyl)LPS alpha-1,2-glucosyltransferase
VNAMGGIEWNEISANSNGGTELMGRELEERLPKELLDEFQIILSRFASADSTKVRILWCHDLPTDPASAHLANGGWRTFHRIVFVSNWQAQAYVNHYGIPWSRCQVLPNAIEPLAVADDRFDPVRPDRPIRLVYTSTPHRGLNILTAAFNKICEERDDVELDVFSSFKLYGWDRRDAPFQDLFEALKQNPRVTYHGAVPHQQLRDAVASSHVFAYPSIWPETSCRCLIEAMSAGLACVHPNFGALHETAAGRTMMYQWQHGLDIHAAVFYRTLMTAIRTIRDGDKGLLSRLAAQKTYADSFYSWDVRAAQWAEFLRGIVNLPRQVEGRRDADLRSYPGH